jgi:hypothetical protein
MQSNIRSQATKSEYRTFSESVKIKVSCQWVTLCVMASRAGVCDGSAGAAGGASAARAQTPAKSTKRDRTLTGPIIDMFGAERRVTCCQGDCWRNVRGVIRKTHLGDPTFFASSLRHAQAADGTRLALNHRPRSPLVAVTTRPPDLFAHAPVGQPHSARNLPDRTCHLRVRINLPRCCAHPLLPPGVPHGGASLCPRDAVPHSLVPPSFSIGVVAA